MEIASEAIAALNILNDRGYEAYLVGGAVRDYLLGRDSSDYDIATNADPNAIKMLFGDYTVYDIGKKHGTVAVHINHLKIEITPFRKEGRYIDHRHPEEIVFTSELKEDLQRRDFTINALALDKDLNVIDYYDGINDLNSKLIRAVGNPDTRFHEDALRILRALRFSAKLKFAIEEDTRAALFRNKDLLACISCERKKDELLQILSHEDALSIVGEYLEIFDVFMPFSFPERQSNFSSPYYSLAYLLKDKDINLKQLKYSKDEIDLIRALISASHIDVNDDYALVSCLSNGHQKEMLEYLEELHDLNLQERYLSLKEYVVDMNALAIDGHEIESLGYHGSDIRKAKEMILEEIHRQRLSNSHESLVDYLKRNIVI